MICDLINAVVRNIADGNATRPGGIQINVVDANSITDDDTRFLHSGNDVRFDRCELSDDCVCFTNEWNQGFWCLALATDNLESLWAKNGLFNFEGWKCEIRNCHLHESAFVRGVECDSMGTAQ